MGQKVNPMAPCGRNQRLGFPLVREGQCFRRYLVEDYNLRKTLKKQLAAAGVPKIEIERDAPRCAFIFTAQSLAW